MHARFENIDYLLSIFFNQASFAFHSYWFLFLFKDIIELGLPTCNRKTFSIYLDQELFKMAVISHLIPMQMNIQHVLPGLQQVYVLTLLQQFTLDASKMVLLW